MDIIRTMDVISKVDVMDKLDVIDKVDVMSGVNVTSEPFTMNTINAIAAITPSKIIGIGAIGIWAIVILAVIISNARRSFEISSERDEDKMLNETESEIRNEMEGNSKSSWRESMMYDKWIEYNFPSIAEDSDEVKEKTKNIYEKHVNVNKLKKESLRLMSRIRMLEDEIRRIGESENEVNDELIRLMSTKTQKENELATVTETLEAVDNILITAAFEEDLMKSELNELKVKEHNSSVSEECNKLIEEMEKLVTISFNDGCKSSEGSEGSEDDGNNWNREEGMKKTSRATFLTFPNKSTLEWNGGERLR